VLDRDFGASAASHTHEELLPEIFDLLPERESPLFAIAHRVVHGGDVFQQPTRIDLRTLAAIEALTPLAPLHQPHNVAGIRACAKLRPQVPQVASFDTAFHRTMPDVAKIYALPAAVRNLGVERYGFHGLSFESVLAQLHDVPPRIVMAHLGNGSSITAIRDRQSVDTTMGLTPAGGVIMGSRCGDLDPGVVVYLMRNGFADAGELEAMFNRQSGLYGVSELTSDVRDLQNARTSDKRADLALRMLCYQVKKAIASMAAVLGGIDLLVFTGGIGENAAGLRDEICSGLRFLGQTPIRVLPSQEDLQIARITAKLALQSA
jgi:acetate kinase